MKNKKNTEKLFDAISDINQSDIEDFANYDDRQKDAVTAKKERPIIKIIGAAAACLILFGGISAGLKFMELKNNQINPGTSSENTDDTSDETEEIQVIRHVYKNEGPYALPEKAEFTAQEQEIADRYYNEMVEKFPEFAKIPRQRLFEYVSYEKGNLFVDDGKELDVEFGFCLGDIGANYWCTYHDYDYGIEEYNDFLNGWKITGDKKFDELTDLQLPQVVNDDIIYMLKKNARACAEENGLELARFVDQDPDDILERVIFRYDENGLYATSITIAEPTDATMPTPHIYAYVGVELSGDTITLIEYPASLEPIFTTENYDYSFTPQSSHGDSNPPYAKPEKAEFTAEQKETVDRVYNEMVEKYPDFGKIDREMLREDILYADNNTIVMFTFCIGGIPTSYQCVYTENVGGVKDWQIHGEEFKPFSKWQITEYSIDDIRGMLAREILNLMKADKLDSDNFESKELNIIWSVGSDGKLYANTEYIVSVTDKTVKHYENTDNAHIFNKVRVTIEETKYGLEIHLIEYPATAN